ncbi:single-stranded-DNA-specific exonuclease RecJ, partial [Acinetobacter ursingii]
DVQLPHHAFDLETLSQIEQLGPWGHKIPLPQIEGEFQVLDYRWLKDSHLKLKLALEDGATVDAIAFNAIDKFEFNPLKVSVRLVYELERNQFN